MKYQTSEILDHSTSSFPFLSLCLSDCSFFHTTVTQQEGHLLSGVHVIPKFIYPDNKPLSPSLCRDPWPHLHVACCPPPKIQEPRRSIPPKLKSTSKSSSPRHMRPPFCSQCSKVAHVIR